MGWFVPKTMLVRPFSSSLCDFLKQTIWPSSLNFSLTCLLFNWVQHNECLWGRVRVCAIFNQIICITITNSCKREISCRRTREAVWLQEIQPEINVWGSHPAGASWSSTDLSCVLDYNLYWIRPQFVAHITEWIFTSWTWRQTHQQIKHLEILQWMEPRTDWIIRQITKQPQNPFDCARPPWPSNPFMTVSLGDNTHNHQPTLVQFETRWHQCTSSTTDHKTWDLTDLSLSRYQWVNSVSQWPQHRTTWAGLGEAAGGSAWTGLSSLCWTLLLDCPCSVNAGLRSSGTICWVRKTRRWGQSTEKAGQVKRGLVKQRRPEKERIRQNEGWINNKKLLCCFLMFWFHTGKNNSTNKQRRQLTSHQ